MVFVFFFFKKKTAYEMRISDWSSDVCSSDLLHPDDDRPTAHFALMIEHGKFVRYDVGNPDEMAPGGGKVGLDADEIRALYAGRVEARPHQYVEGGQYLRVPATEGAEIGRASWRERVCQYV